MTTTLKIIVDKKERMGLSLPHLREVYSFNVIQKEDKPANWQERAAEFDPYTIYTSTITIEKVDMQLAIALKKLLLNSPTFEKLKIVIDDFENFEITKKETAKEIYERLSE
jgi:hypothetical protein